MILTPETLSDTPSRRPGRWWLIPGGGYSACCPECCRQTSTSNNDPIGVSFACEHCGETIEIIAT